MWLKILSVLALILFQYDLMGETSTIYCCPASTGNESRCPPSEYNNCSRPIRLDLSIKCASDKNCKDDAFCCKHSCYFHNVCYGKFNTTTNTTSAISTTTEIATTTELEPASQLLNG